MHTLERGRIEDMMVVTGEGGLSSGTAQQGWQDGIQEPRASTETHQNEAAILSQDPSDSGKNQRPEMRKSYLSGLDLHGRLLWLEMPPEVMLVLVVRAATADCEEA